MQTVQTQTALTPVLVTQVLRLWLAYINNKLKCTVQVELSAQSDMVVVSQHVWFNISTFWLANSDIVLFNFKLHCFSYSSRWISKNVAVEKCCKTHNLQEIFDILKIRRKTARNYKHAFKITKVVKFSCDKTFKINWNQTANKQEGSTNSAYVNEGNCLFHK